MSCTSASPASGGGNRLPGAGDERGPREARRASGRRILVVDDEEDIREVLDFTLRRAGYAVVTASSGLEAVRAATSDRFDLLITDYRMPGMTGSETVAAVKGLSPATRVLVATGYFSDEAAEECRQRGAEELIRKPFDLEELLQLVRRMLP
jgi:ATP-dependent Lon protease